MRTLFAIGRSPQLPLAKLLMVLVKTAVSACSFREKAPERRALWIALIVLWNLAFVMPLFGPMMHESDQASLLEGAVVISQTGDLVGQPFYNYDKQFGSYWIVAAALRCLGATPDPADVAMLGNAVSVVFFNAGLLLLVFSLPSPATLLLLSCLLFAPALIIHAPFLAGNYLSASFIFAQFVALRRTDSTLLPVPCAFCATACRADALLAQPLVLWSTTRANTFTDWMRDGKLWGCVTAAGAALLLGKVLTAAGAEFSSPFAFFLHWKILAVYSVFGLGAGIAILLVCLVGFAGIIRRATAPAFSLVGLLCLLLPFAYYAVNLYSTRHWTVALVALMCFVASDRGTELLSARSLAIRPRPVILALLALCALVPIFLGFRLSANGSPRLTMWRPALVPSADGLIPLGSYLSYAWGWNRPVRQIPDHNQATWLAALSADFGDSGRSPVQLLVSPLTSIVRLALRLRGLEYQLTEKLEASGVTYTEFRAVRKAPIGHARGRLRDILARPFSRGVEFASPIFAGEAIVRLTPAPNLLAERLEKLRDAFAGNDYHFVASGPTASWSDAEPGHLMVLVSQAPFKVILGRVILTPEKNDGFEGEHYYLLKFLVQDDNSLTVEGVVGVAALSVLPTSMTLEAF